MDYNQRCTGYHKSKVKMIKQNVILQYYQLFSEKLVKLVRDISEPIPMKKLSFLVDACQLLKVSFKVKYC